jgi:beta-lactamase regulating signal transducer with metallopeptidase domain
MMGNNLSLEAIAPPVVAWLLTFAIHSTLLLGPAWLAARYARSPRLKDLVWKTALVGGVLTATLQAFWSVGPVAAQFDLSSDAATVQEIDSVDYPGPSSELAGAAVRANRAPDEPGSGVVWLFALWLAGASLATLRFGVARRRLYAGLGPRREISGGPLCDALDQLCLVAGVRRRVRLTCSHRISSPLALNAGEICLPQQALSQLEAEQQAALLAHELAHVARRDPLWLLLSGALECLFFFQPLIAVARRRMQECAEYVCDEQAARYTGDGLALAKCLVQVSRWPRQGVQPVAIAAMAGGAPTLEQRVRRLLDGSATVAAPRRWWWAGLIVAMLLLVGCVGPRVSVVVDFPNLQTGRAERPGSLLWPVEGEITQPYSASHLALDIAAKSGTPVAAAAAGVVTVAGWDNVHGYGNMVVIDHGGGLSTFYSHLTDYQVEVGNRVTAGQVIGRVGSTGRATGPHLHFEVRQGDERINPLALLQD